MLYIFWNLRETKKKRKIVNVIDDIIKIKKNRK